MDRRGGARPFIAPLVVELRRGLCSLKIKLAGVVDRRGARPFIAPLVVELRRGLCVVSRQN